MKTHKEYEIFAGITLRKAFENCFKAGYRPASAKEVHKILDSGKLKALWYDTGTFYRKGALKSPKLKSIKDVEKIVDKGWKPWYIYGLGDGPYAIGNNILDDYIGCLVGVKNEKKGEKK